MSGEEKWFFFFMYKGSIGVGIRGINFLVLWFNVKLGGELVIF